MGVGAGLAAGGLGSIVQGVSGYYQNEAQLEAAREAFKKQEQLAGQQQKFNAQQYGQARADFDQGMRRGINEQGKGYDASVAALQQGYNRASGFGQQGFRQASDTLGQSGQQFRDTTMAGLGQATGQLNQGYNSAIGGMTPWTSSGANQGRVAQLFANGVDVNQDPGARFRQQQGEQAITRLQASQGGRAGGRALQELTKFNSDLASQEYGNAFQRQMQAGQAADQMGLSAQSQLAQLQAGQGQSLANMSMNAYGNIAGQNGALAQQLAGLQSQYGRQMGQLAYGQGQNLANLATGNASTLAQLYGQQGQGMANLSTGLAGQNSALTQALMGQAGGQVPYAGGGLGAIGNAAGQLGGLGMMAGLSGIWGGGGGGWSDWYSSPSSPGSTAMTRGWGGQNY